MLDYDVRCNLAVFISAWFEHHYSSGQLFACKSGQLQGFNRRRVGIVQEAIEASLVK